VNQTSVKANGEIDEQKELRKMSKTKRKKLPKKKRR